MSDGSERVKKWRECTKLRIVEAMGGKCCICGYNKCNTSLALHHLNPKNKELSFGAIRASPKSWKTIFEELEKCILVCHNCHGEIHSNLHIDLLKTLKSPIIDPKYKDYKNFQKEQKRDLCPICGNMKSIYFKTCSKNCAAKKCGKIKWENYNLEEMIKTNTIVNIAEIIGCSDAAVHKRLKKLDIDKIKN